MTALTARPIALQARAWWGEQLVAETTAAVRAEELGQPPTLYFPLDDVRVDLFEDEGGTATCPLKGTARLWTIPGRVAPAALGSWGADELPDLTDGKDVVWTFTDPAPGLDWLSGLVAFDHDRVRVELVDALGGTDPRAVTTKRFPTWGDEADVVAALTPRRAGERTFVVDGSPESGRPVIEGSQILGEAIVAAAELVPGRRVVSAHMVFLRAADARLPLELELEELTNGRSFTALGVRAVQEGRLRASGTLLLDVTAPDLIRHGAAAPDVAGPYESPPLDMGVTGRDIRIVDGAYSADPHAPVGPPVLDAWVRFGNVGEDVAVHAALLAQFSGHLSIAAAMRPHDGIGEAQAHRTISTGINAITLALHSDIRADQWMLYRHLSTFAGDGMTHSECRVHDEAGALLASFSVEGMVRGFVDSGKARDPRTAM